MFDGAGARGGKGGEGGPRAGRVRGALETVGAGVSSASLVGRRLVNTRTSRPRPDLNVAASCYESIARLPLVIFSES